MKESMTQKARGCLRGGSEVCTAAHSITLHKYMCVRVYVCSTYTHTAINMHTTNLGN